MNKTTIFSILAVVLLGVLATSVFAIPQFNAENQGRFQNGEMRTTMNEHHELIEAAIESGDYETYRSAIESLDYAPRMSEFVTEENFATFVEMHEAMESGDYETASQLREELGFEMGFRGQGNRDGTGQGRSMRGSGSGYGSGNGLSQGHRCMN